MADRNLILQLLITAKDAASSVLGKLFSSLNDGTNVIAGKIRDGFANLFGGAIDSAAAFEKQLGKVQAKGDQSYQDTEQLKIKLQELAAQFGITGTEAAQGMEVLAAAGLNAGDAMKALPSVLNLAKMENLSLDDAATKLSDTLSIMGMKFSEAGTMADVLAKGANISTASAASLAEALSVAGGQAKSAGLDLKATVAALDLLHSAGIKGSAAGTSLAAILTQLQNPASAASKELNTLGIHSRNLGDVLDGLKAAGVKAGPAILAFGETAGPGLQAMISKGSAGLKDFGGQLRNSGGAAKEAADKLDQNFNAALSSLAAAWDSIKGALAEPILKPIADGAREVATALNTALISGALKPAQEAIKTFATEGVAAVKEFVKNFDFQTAMTALGGFLTSAKESFEGIKTAGNTAADGVTIAWNAVTAGFKTIGAALLAVASQTVSALAATEEAASKIGLGSAERANELRQTASALEAKAAELVNQVAQDSAEMGAAFDRMTGKTDEAKAAQERLKAALPTNEIQAINYTLKDYQTLADRANAATEAARAAHEAGKLSAQDYGVKLMASAEANKALADATAAQSASTDNAANSTNEAKNKLAEYDRQIKAGEANAAEWQSGMELNSVKMLGLRDAAQATGEKLAYLKTVKDTLPNADQQIAEATKESKAALDRYTTALSEHITQLEAKQAAVERSNSIEQKGYDLLIANAKAEGELATAKGDTEAATRAEADATELQNQKAAAAIAKKNEEIVVYQGLIAATKEKLAEDGTLNAADQAQLATMADTLTAMGQERDAMAQSLQATQALTEAKKQKKAADEAAAQAAKDAAAAEAAASAQRAAAGNAVNAQWSAANEVLEKTGGNIEKLNAAFIKNQEAYSRNAQDFIDWSRRTAVAADEVVQAYESQKDTLEKTTQVLADYAETGEWTGEVQRAMALASSDLESRFNLLDTQDFDQLQASLDRANAKLAEMAQLTEDARAELGQLNAELLDAQGQDQKAKLLREQLDYEERLARIETQRAEAEAMGNRELLGILAKQQAVLEAIHATKLKNIQADTAAADATTRTTTTLRTMADEAERAHAATRAFASVDMSQLASSAEQIKANFMAIKGLM